MIATVTACTGCMRRDCRRRELCVAAHQVGAAAAQAADALGEDRYRGHLYPEVRDLMLEAARRFQAIGTKSGRDIANTWLFRAGAR